MGDLTEKIYEIVKNNDGIKAIDIAKKLGCDRHEVNSILFSAKGLKNKCYQDDKYKWYALEKKPKTVKQKKVQKKEIDIKLNKLCKYYLECISVERSSGLSAFLKSKFAPEYIEIAGVDYEALNNDKVSEYLLKNNKMKQSSNYLGYPVMVDKMHAKDGKEYWKVYPVLYFNIDYEAGKLDLSLIPNFNSDIIKKYVNNNEQEAIQEELLLEDELGLNNKDSDIPLDELVLRLQNIRTWDWKEELDPLNLNDKIKLEDIEESGIYNKAIVISTEKSPFTIGLENELQEISTMSKEDIKGTALYNWIYGNNVDNIQTNNNLLEVLPLNTEQKDAVLQTGNSNTLIVTGPPGTGKSQVVTNMIVNLTYNGKSSLFSSKNNKAVSVVDTRVNALAKKPVMLRLGSNAIALDLATTIENLLSAFTEPEDFEKYKSLKESYNKLLTNKEELLTKKNDYILLRNSTDKLEQELYNYQLFKDGILEVKTNTPDTIRKLYDDYIKKLKQSNKKNASLFVKLFWKKFAKERKENLKISYENLASETRKYNISFIEKNEDGHESYRSKNKEVNELIKNLNGAISYKKKLKLLKSSESLEELDLQISKLDKQLSKIAGKLWNEWLLTQNAIIDSNDRKDMASYVSTIKLLKGAKTTELPDDVKKQLKKVQNKAMKYLPCWAVTSLSVKGRIPLNAGMFDVLIIDEASQCDIASIIPLLYRTKKVVIIGDPRQLSHISSISKKQDLNMMLKYEIDPLWSYSSTSLYDLASSLVNANKIIHLRDHHRCYGDIIEFSNREFYDGKLRIATNYSKLRIPEKEKAGIRWVEIKGNTIRPNNGGAYNKEEAIRVVEEIKQLVKNDYKGSIGVVTPFKAQAELIKKEIEKDSKLLDKLIENGDKLNEIFLVDTVHKFQGDERDVIFFSPVVSNNTPQSSLLFLSNTGNLFNVAITRARSTLIVVGDKDACLNSNVSYLMDFAKYVEELNNKKEVVNEKITYTKEYPEVDNIEQVSEWEKYFYKKLYEAGIHTIPQYSEDKYRLDLAIIKGRKRLDIEIDGEMYHKDWNGELCYRDQLRNQRLFELGWDVKRFWVYQIRDDTNWCINEIQKWIDDTE